MSCYWEHLREHIENFENIWEPDRNVLGTWWELIRNKKKNPRIIVLLENKKKGEYTPLTLFSQITHVQIMGLKECLN